MGTLDEALMRKLLGIAVATCFLSAPAFAVPITFEFGAEGTGSIRSFCCTNDYDRYQATVDGVRLIARGYENVDLDPVGSYVGNEFWDREQVTRDTSGFYQGLGVNSDDGDSNQLNGGNQDEAIRFSLSVSGVLTQIVFNNWGRYDAFDLSVDGYGRLNNNDPAGGIWNGFLSFNSRFAIGADSRYERFRIRSITVDVVSVPAPGTLALFGIGLLGLAATRRRWMRQ